eukprot:6050572-Prymnesium_polylepis.1
MDFVEVHSDSRLAIMAAPEIPRKDQEEEEAAERPTERGGRTVSRHTSARGLCTSAGKAAWTQVTHGTK